MTDDNYFLKMYIENLFKNNLDRDINENMRAVSDYYHYFAEKLDVNKLLELDRDLIKSFESVYLWLRDKLIVYPNSIKDQVENIIKGNKLLELFALLSFLSEEELSNIRKRIQYQELPLFISFILKMLYRLPKIEDSNDKLLSSESILNSKISLNRLSQVVKYASSYELIDYDEAYDSFKEHYNPNLVDKNKVIALINIIKVQTNELEDSNDKKRILDRLDEIEGEVKKKNVRWGAVIAGLFMLLGFLADLKTVSPSFYDNLYNTTSKVISVILEDGQVQKKEKLKLTEFNEAPKDATDVKINKTLE